MEFANKMFLSSNYAARRLQHVYIFLKIPIDKGSDSFKLINLQVVMSGNINDVPNSLPSNCELKCLLKFHTLYLFITLNNNMGFEDNRMNIIGARLLFIDPFCCDWSNAKEKWNMLLCLIFHE